MSAPESSRDTRSCAVEPLGADHDRSAFDSGEPALDEFLRKHARQNQERGISRTFVAVRPGERQVVGFYTLASGSVAFQTVPEEVRKRLPRYPVPVVHLARLGVDRSAAGKGLGGALLADVLARAVDVADQIGVWAVQVQAKHEKARAFYAHHGFEPLADDPLSLYLPIATARNALAT